MYYYFLLAHSWLRWAVLIVAVWTVLRSLFGWLGKQNFTKGDNQMGAALVGLVHTQFLLGLILYAFLSPQTQAAFKDFGAAMKNSTLRFWAVEHITMMVIAVILTQMGRSLAKKAKKPTEKHKKMAIFVGLALILTLLSIPWNLAPLFRM